MNTRQINVLRAMWQKAYGNPSAEKRVICLIRDYADRYLTDDPSFDVDQFIQQIVGK